MNMQTAVLLGLVAALAGCSVDALDSAAGSESRSALSLGLAPARSVAAATYSADGSVTFRAKLPSNQKYVEVFARKNGIQNVAQAIVASGVVDEDGTTTYSYEAAGYQIGDVVEYRFYSYQPDSAGVFTPGPSEGVWATLVAGESEVTLPVRKDASLIGFSYSVGDGRDKNFGEASTVDVASYHHESQALFGFGLSAVPTHSVVTRARLVLKNVHSASGSAGSAALGLVDRSASWDETTVTRRSAPSVSAIGEYPLPARGEASLDVTSLVANAMGAGQPEISFMLLPRTGNFFIDSKENASGMSAVLEVALAPSAAVLTGSIVTRWYVPNQVLRSSFLELQWTAPAGFENDVDHYELYTTTSGGAAWEYWMNAYGNSMSLAWSPDRHVAVSVVAVSKDGARSAKSNVLSL